MRMILNRRFQNRVKGLFEKYEFEVGILKDGPHYSPKYQSKELGAQSAIKSFAGGPARKVTRNSSTTIGAVSRENRQRMGKNYLTDPFSKKSSDIIKFSNEFFKLVFGRSQAKRAENLLQAIVRNPILRGDYGKNTQLTAERKGFNRKLIDTAQFFKAIRAKINTRSTRV